MGSKIEARSLVEAVTERLEASIISGDLEPGTRLREQVLAKEYGISRGPLREAIRRLEGRRLLERKANIGVSVVALSLRRLDELLKVREALEGMACRLAAERIEQDEVDQIRKLLDEHALRDEVLSGEGYYQQSGDFDFHFRIAKASGNEYLMDMISGDLYDLLRIYRYKSSTMTGRAVHALREHATIVDALEARDPDAAEAAMRTHIANARKHAILAMETAAKKEADKAAQDTAGG
ncbi:GntR family transcriptional regulator [Roseovarius sp.]|jgi:DNA-binding GntR family transcriptional regulator|uniref:GntR family transcriptional regulator n=1 Tax=Roseovarius sp. TaxID=1486281 RepID=UPI00261E4074|nr:GntR family transcriptional regulator [Roseovarius sp.]MDM8167878.1 GntR family transcriptional regulator [Roseovarius sp.]